MLGHRPRLAHSQHGEHQHPVRRQLLLSLGIATLLAVIALLLLPPHAHGTFL